jgi:insulysin
MDLAAGAGSDSTEYSFFSVSMRLTDSGHGKLLPSFCSLRIETDISFCDFKHILKSFCKSYMCTISEHMEDIIGLVFKYLRLLKEDGIHEWIFDEVIDRYVIHLYYLVKFFDRL